jgi:hypothetical protein
MVLLGDEDEGLKMEPAACEPVRVFSPPRGPDGLVVRFESPLSATFFHEIGVIEELAVFPRFKGDSVFPEIKPSPCPVYVVFLKTAQEIEERPRAWGFLAD